MENIFTINQKDNVAVALSPLKKGEGIAKADIPVRHKIATRDIKKGEPIIKYGFPIGYATADIEKGEWVHTHNVKTTLSENHKYCYNPKCVELKKSDSPTHFDGYLRADGQVGIRNEVWIVPTVGCVNAIAKQIAEECQSYADGTDGLFAYNHPYGCSQLGDDHVNTQKALCGIIKHANAGAVLVLGLGCENNLIKDMKTLVGDCDSTRIRFLNCQDCEDEVSEGIAIVKELCEIAKKDTRVPCPADKLILGLKCGGSDGFSGITANPLVGAVSDKVVRDGGTVILTEVPEMFGAETVLMDRCESKAVFEKTVALINDFKDYFRKNDQPIDSNPSPGNKAGGITTLEEKSLGCIQKGGTATVREVLSYGERVQKTGVNLLQGPGNDLVSSCAMTVSGAQMILFTTGMGTPFGCPVPTVKISSNSELYRFKNRWIDFDAGALVSGEDLNTLSDNLYSLILDIASGRVKAKSESLDKSNLAIFKNGITL